MPHLLAVVLKLTVDDPFPWTVHSSGPNPLAKIVPVKGRAKEIVVINDVRLQATLEDNRRGLALRIVEDFGPEEDDINPRGFLSFDEKGGERTVWDGGNRRGCPGMVDVTDASDEDDDGEIGMEEKEAAADELVVVRIDKKIAVSRNTIK